MRVEQLMMREVKVCTERDSLNRAAELMWNSDCGCVPVISANGDGGIVGIVTDRDIAMAAYAQGKQLWAIPAGISQAKALMRDNKVRRLPVCGELLISPESATRHTHLKGGPNGSRRRPTTRIMFVFSSSFGQIICA